MQAMTTTTPYSPLQPGVEMFQRGKMQPLFYSDLSLDTDFLDAETDFEDSDDAGSDFEDDESSPRESLESVSALTSARLSADANKARAQFGRRSATTATTNDEAITPKSQRHSKFPVHVRNAPSVTESIQGPRGPHLFRASLDSFNFVDALQMSPLVAKQPPVVTIVPSPLTVSETPRPFQPLDTRQVRDWTPAQVARWMRDFGFDEAVVDKFEAHDIAGAVLLDLEFDDLKELEIPSFGMRHRIWTELGVLRPDGLQDSDDHSAPRNDTRRKRDMSRRRGSDEDLRSPYSARPRRSNEDLHNPRSARPRRSAESLQSPTLSRGCSSNESLLSPVTAVPRQRRPSGRPRDDAITPGESVSIVAIEQLIPKPHRCSKGENCSKWRKQQRMYEKLDQEHGFTISPTKGGQIFIAGNPGNAHAAPKVVDNVVRPASDVVPSVVASSDLLGPGQAPDFPLQEQMLRGWATRDAQENVKQFLHFQHFQPSSSEMPPSPPLETPKLELFPNHATPGRANPRLLPRLSIPGASSSNLFSPCLTALSPLPDHFRRNAGTPASDMDVPLTAIPMGPIARDTSQSVPPNMQFRSPVQRRPSSREMKPWHRASLRLPTLPETSSEDPTTAVRPSIEDKYGRGTTHAGWMKKRKTRLLRHEWQEAHYRLTGTRLAMHMTDEEMSRALETIDVDDYWIACSSVGGNSKLAAALKSLRIASSKAKSEDASFAFQLVPEVEKSSLKKFLKEGSENPWGKNKTHIFSVGSRDERIEWMREVMLAKALRQKEGGFEVCINGEMA